MLAKGRLSSVKESTGIQTVQVTINGEVHDGVERLQNFGFTSYPKKDAQLVVSFIGGNRERPVVTVIDDGNYRIKLVEGEAAIYNAFGNVIKLSADGTISLGDDSVLAPTAGVVTGECIDPFTGAPHADKSLIVKAKKV